MNVILKLTHSSEFQESYEGVKIQKIVSSISPLEFVKLLHGADNKVNPRTASENPIIKSILNTLEETPELFWFKSKGILISTEMCERLDRNRVRLSFDEPDYEGIMDGGHNSLAIAKFILLKLYGKSYKTWKETKDFWEDRYEEILTKFNEHSEDFKFTIPIEIISPNLENGSINDFYDYIADICSARNNNVQLKETAKGNQVGYYDYLKEILPDYPIIWKTGNAGKIKSEDVISLACLPLIFLKEINVLPDSIKTLNKISLYSQKSKCIDFFNQVMADEDVSLVENGKYNLENDTIKSALKLTDDIIRFFDKLYKNFPTMYHKAIPGKFGRIVSVEMKESRMPFLTSEDKSEYKYPYGFFYPLLCGITKLMVYDKEKQEVNWRKNPLDLNLLDLHIEQYVELVKVLNFDPNKVGKANVCYNEAENVFQRI